MLNLANLYAPQIGNNNSTTKPNNPLGPKDSRLNNIYTNIDGEEFQKPMIKGNIVKPGLDNENIKSMLSDVDEDYANSETLNM